MYRLAIDVGGTHTDALAATEKGALFLSKTETTAFDLTQGVITVCGKLAKQLGISLENFLGQVDLFVHGTTVGTNAVLQEKGARVGCLVTDGFRDVVELRRGYREYNLGFDQDFPAPLSARYLRVPVKERLSHTGAELESLDEAGVRKATEHLRNNHADSVAITFLNSFLNSSHEQRARELVQQTFPEIPVSLSSEILPRIGEFERFSTTILNAYIAPVMQNYLKQLSARLRERRFKGLLLLGQANGGVNTVEEMLKRPVWSLGSGPAAGGVSAQYYGEVGGSQKVIGIDMGGTSLDVLLLVDGEARVTTGGYLGSYCIALPTVEVHSIGAGGGSIAWIDPSGVLRVGPRSAESTPGPACYGKGGEEPTVTDADLILGYLNPDNFLGGERKLRKDLALNTVTEKVAAKQGLSVEEAAGGILRVLVHNTAEAIRRKCMEKAEDPRDFLLVVGGGAGPTHAALIAEELEIPRVILPGLSSVYCAFGWIRSDMVVDLSRSRVLSSSQVDLDWLNSAYQEMEKEATAILGDGKVSFKRVIEAHYYGQFQELEVPLPNGVIGKQEIQAAIEEFHQSHEHLFYFKVPEMELEFIHYRLRASLGMAKPKPLPRERQAQRNGKAVIGERKCIFDKKALQTPIYDGMELAPGKTVTGPGVIESSFTSLVVPPGFQCVLEQSGDYVLTRR